MRRRNAKTLRAEAAKRHPRKPSKRSSQRSSANARKRRFVAPRTSEDFFGRPKAFQEQWNLGLHALSLMRNSPELSLRKASKEAGIDPRTVRTWMSPALRKCANRRFKARSNDTLLRILKLPAPEPQGRIEVVPRDYREASLIGRYHRAIKQALNTGDAKVFTKLRRKTILAADGKRIPLLFDLEALHLLDDAGLLSYEDIYAQTA